MQISLHSAPKLLTRMLVALTVMLLLAPVGIASAAAKPAASAGTPNVLKPEEGPTASAAEAGEEAEAEEEEEEEETEAEEEQEELEELEEAEEAEEEYEAEAKAEARAAAGKHQGDGGVHIAKLALTRSAKSALEHGHPTASKVSFTFALSAKSNVRFQLARELHHGVVSNWHPMSTISLTAKRGANTGHLYSTGKLSTGEYKLTLTPADGHAKTLQFEVK